MTTPRCGLLFHFTHVDNLPAILEAGALLCDSTVHPRQLLATEAGDIGIKQRRRTRRVTCAPGGVVADYVPFYFAARSPMMLKLRSGGVPTFDGDHRDLVYLLTDVDEIVRSGRSFAISDRNAAVAVADFSNDVGVLGDLAQRLPISTFIDWAVMHLTYWNDTAQYPDRMERRMAEFLVYDSVPLDLLTGVAVHSDRQRAMVERLFDEFGWPIGVELRPTGTTPSNGAAMIREQHGNLLRADADALVNTVNTVGVMGKGIALQFKRAYPENYKAYKRACDRGAVELGQMFIWDAGALVDEGPRFIINFPTKRHWRSKSRLADIRAGLDDLVAHLRDLPVKSVAVPPLGCGHGGLRWSEVKPLIEEAFGRLPDVEVLLFPPEGAPAVDDQPIRTDRPKMTYGRAAVVAVMERYLPYAVEVTAVDIQKLMYFVQEAGEPLKLRFVKGTYGPYADNLRHVLQEMEGHYIRGIGDGSAKALDTIPFEILDGASTKAAAVLAARPNTAAHLDRVAQLIEGFESTYGLELLATVHWAASRDEQGNGYDAPRSASEVEGAVASWNRRNGQLFTSRHIETALDHLQQLGWLEPAEPAGLFADA